MEARENLRDATMANEKALFWKPNLNTLAIIGGVMISVGVFKQNINDHERRIVELERGHDSIRAESTAGNVKILQELTIIGDKIARIETAIEYMQKPIPQSRRGGASKAISIPDIIASNPHE